MSVAVQLPTGFHKESHWSGSSINMFGAAVCMSGNNLVRTVSTENSTRLKTQISRSREGSPADRLACKGCSRLSPSPAGIGSPKRSPLMSRMTRLQVTHCKTVNTVGSNHLMKPELCSRPVSPSLVCEKIKALSVCSPKPITSDEFAARFEHSTSRPFLLIDCRSFVAYNIIHISGALSLNCCDRLTKKRLQSGKIRIIDIISGTEGKDRYNALIGGADLILYDDESTDLSAESPCSSLKLVTTTLLKEGKDVYFLKGGLSAFQNSHREMCVRSDYKPSPKLLCSPTTPTVIDDQIDTAIIAQILPFLYIGNERDAANLDLLREHGITHVLNVTSHIPLHFESQGIIYKRLPASDSGHQNLKQYFADACSFIESVRKTGGKLLVHCQAGVSRSATMTICYILKHSNFSMIEAYRFVKSKRTIVAPNFNFMGQLYELEQHLLDGSIQRNLEPQLQLE